MATIRSLVMKEAERIEKYAKAHQYLHKGFFLDLPQMRTKKGTARQVFSRKQYEELATLTGKDITQYIRYVTDYGEVLSYKEGLKYTREQRAAIREAARQARIKYESIDTTVISYFLEERAWAHSTPKMMDYVRDWVNEICSQPNGEKILALALENAHSDGVVREVQIYSYFRNVGEVLYSQLQPYVKSAADYFEAEIRYPIRLAAELDNMTSNLDADEEDII